ncbi:ciliary neurotrophic factor [Xenentodon cancila]
MAESRTRSVNGSNLSRTTPAWAAGVAAQLQHECSNLLELYRKQESLPADLGEGRMVSVPPPSSQLDSRDKLWRLHSALLQCRSLLERAVDKEEEELTGGDKGEYKNQRTVVKERLSSLVLNTGELLKAADGAAVSTPSMEGLELAGPTNLFELKLWVNRIYKEVEHWAKIAITTLKELPSDVEKGRKQTLRARRLRSRRR